jgi:hypothetical protein
LPCLPLTPNKVSDLEMTPDAYLGSGSLRLLSKPPVDTLSNSLRRRAAVARALTGSFLQSPRDAQMINVRDLGALHHDVYSPLTGYSYSVHLAENTCVYAGSFISPRNPSQP